MFKFNVESSVFEDAVRKIMIAIPASNKQGTGDCIQMTLYKNVGESGRSVGIFLAFNAKIEAISTMEIRDVASEEKEMKVFVSGSKLAAAASAFGALDTVLEITVNKEMSISGAGSKVSLPLGEDIAKINPNEAMQITAEMETEAFVKFIEFSSSCYQDTKGVHGMNCVGLRFDLQQNVLSATSSNGSRAVYAEIPDITIRRVEKKSDQAAPDESGVEDTKITITVEGNILKSAVRNLGGKSKITISTDGKRLVLKKGAYVIIILTSEQAFPFDSVVQIMQKNEDEGIWKAPIDKIMQALSIYEITMEKPWLEIKKNGESKMSFQGKDELTTASVICAQKGEIDRVVLDEKQFKEALSVFASRYTRSSEICIGVSDEKLPVSVKKNQEDANCIIIMPIAS